MAQTAASKHPEGREPIDKVRRLQRKLHEAAKQQKGRRFHVLYDRIYRSDVLEEAWNCVRSNKGAAGVDALTLDAVEKYDLTDRGSLGAKDVRVVIERLNHVVRGWGNHFSSGNASEKFNQIDSYLHRRLHAWMVKRRGRNLRAGQADEWTRQWFWDKGLHRLLGTIRYPKQCKLPVKTPAKPYAGKSHVRFERRRVEPV